MLFFFYDQKIHCRKIRSGDANCFILFSNNEFIVKKRDPGGTMCFVIGFCCRRNEFMVGAGKIKQTGQTVCDTRITRQSHSQTQIFDRDREIHTQKRRGLHSYAYRHKNSYAHHRHKPTDTDTVTVMSLSRS